MQQILYTAALPWYGVSSYINLDIIDSIQPKASRANGQQTTHMPISFMLSHRTHAARIRSLCQLLFFLSDKIINTIIQADYSFSQMKTNFDIFFKCVHVAACVLQARSSFPVERLFFPTPLWFRYVRKRRKPCQTGFASRLDDATQELQPKRPQVVWVGARKGKEMCSSANYLGANGVWGPPPCRGLLLFDFFLSIFKMKSSILNKHLSTDTLTLYH